MLCMYIFLCIFVEQTGGERPLKQTFYEYIKKNYSQHRF